MCNWDTLLHYTSLYYTLLLHFPTLYYSLLSNSMQHCIELYCYTAYHCIVIYYCTAHHCIALNRCIAQHCSLLYFTLLMNCTVHTTAQNCNGLDYVIVETAPHFIALHIIVLYWNIALLKLHCTASHMIFHYCTLLQ